VIEYGSPAPVTTSLPSRASRAPCAASWLVFAALFATPLAARADLRADADRLARHWAGRGARVERLTPLFLEHGTAKSLWSEPKGVPPSGKTGCLAVAFLGVRTADFFLSPEELGLPAAMARAMNPHPDLEDDQRLRSAGGAAVLSRCGADQSELRRVRVDLASSRAAVEVLVVRSEKPVDPVADALPERAAGPLAPRGDPGGPIEPGPLAARRARVTARRTGAGASRVSSFTVHAGANGAGQLVLKLPEGCHTLDLLAEVPTTVPRRATDLDAEVRDSQSGRILARDRADVPDARLDFCLGDATSVDVSFIGASGPELVVVSDAHWAMPLWIPTRHGSRARAGFASALFRRHAPAPPDAAMFETIGASGVTSFGVEVEPGQCYVASVALVRGDARALRLAVDIGERGSRDEAGERGESAALAFCAEEESSAHFEIDARGNTPFWALAVWPVGGSHDGAASAPKPRLPAAGGAHHGALSGSKSRLP
jgi:hypothetical protein